MKTTANIDQSVMIKGCVNNDRIHQEILYRLFFNAMIRMCMRYTDDQDLAMEIVNDGFLKVFKKIHTYTAKGSLEGWIRRIVFHTLSDHFRKKSSKVRFVEIKESDAFHSEVLESNLEYDDLLHLVTQLPNMGRQVFVLYAIEGYTHKEIGQQLNISSGTSKWHLSKSREFLKKKLKEEYKISRYA